MLQYLTIYSDKSGRVETAITNSFSENGTNCLEITIDGISFKGSRFDDFELSKSDNFTKKQLERFAFNKVPIFQSNDLAWHLCNCSFDVRFPITLIDLEKETERVTSMNMLLRLGKPKANGGVSKSIALFELKIDNEHFTSKCDDFETAFKQLQREMLLKYRFKNCFSCHYSDYSLVGNDFFGTMMCFRNNKTAYLTASTKEEHFKVAGLGFIAVQETYLCEQFEPREKDTGYRGWPFD